MIGREKSRSGCKAERDSWHNRGDDDPRFAGSSQCREKSVMFVRNLNRIKRAGVPPGLANMY
jgi:hypothetical protein